MDSSSNTASSLPIVIFIPGIMGTSLVKTRTHKRAWASDSLWSASHPAALGLLEATPGGRA